MKFKREIIGLSLGVILLGLVGCSETTTDSVNNGSVETSVGHNAVDTSVNENSDKTSSVGESSDNMSVDKDSIDMVAESMDNLNNAKEITVTKDLISFTNSYSINIDGTSFGEITGKYIKATGDKFTLKDNEGNELSSEKQIKRWNIKLNRLAEVYDAGDKVVGYIGEEVIKDMFNIGYTFHFYDKNKNEIGVSKQKAFSFLDTFKIYDTNDKLCYEINAKFTLMSEKYTITVYDNSTIPTDQVVYLTAILNSIKKADAAKK